MSSRMPWLAALSLLPIARNTISRAMPTMMPSRMTATTRIQKPA